MWNHRIKPDGCSVSFQPHHEGGHFYAEFFANDTDNSFMCTYEVVPHCNLDRETFLDKCVTAAYLLRAGTNDGVMTFLVPELRRR